MGTVDTKTNVYEISRTTIPSISNIKDYIDSQIEKEVEDNNNSTIGGMTEAELLDLFDSWLPGYHLVHTGDVNDENYYYNVSNYLKSELDENIAITGQMYEVQQNHSESIAQLTQFTYVTYDDVEALVLKESLAYASAVESLAYDTNTLKVTYDGVETRLIEGMYVWAGEIPDLTEVKVYPSVGEICAEVTSEVIEVGDVVGLGGSVPTYYQYVGDYIDGELWYNGAGCRGFMSTIASSIGAAKNIYTDANGYVTGWSYLGGSGDSGSISKFVISADNFYIQDSGSTGGAVPFKVENGVTTIGTETIARYWGQFTQYNIPTNANNGTV